MVLVWVSEWVLVVLVLVLVVVSVDALRLLLGLFQ